MPITRALGIAADRKVVELEEEQAALKLEIFRKGNEVFIEKKKFDVFVEQVKKDKGIKFSLTGYSIHKNEPSDPKSKTYYRFPKSAYKPFAMLLGLPALNNVKPQ